MNGANDLDKHTETLSYHLRESVRLERNIDPDWRTAADDITNERPDWIVEMFVFGMESAGFTLELQEDGHVLERPAAPAGSASP